MPHAARPLVIQAQRLSFARGEEEILSDFSFDIHAGDYVAVIGPNGGGKSTLLKLLLGLTTPTSGSIAVFGSPIRQARRQHRLGYVPQHGGLLELHFPATVEEVVKSAQIRTTDPQAITRAMKDLDILNLRHKSLSSLSGGQRQRTLLARALASEPELLFLDEPTDGLDAEAQERFHTAIKKRNEEKALTIVYVTHDVHSIAKETTAALCLKHHLVCHGHSGEACLVRGKQLQNLYHSSRQELEGHHDVAYV